MDGIKRVILHNTFRNGFYWRITENGKTSYYKPSTLKKVFPSLNKSNVENVIKTYRQQRDTTKEIRESQKQLTKLEEGEFPDGVTVHFRIDYGSNKYNKVFTELRDTFVEIRDSKGRDSEDLIREAKDLLGDYWASLVGFEKARNIVKGIEESDLQVGIEKGVSGGIIQITTQHGTYSTTRSKLQTRLEEFSKEKSTEREFIKQHKGEL